MALFKDETVDISELLTCPVNADHKVKPSHMIKHVMDCVKNCGRKYLECPLNYEHIVETHLLNDHIMKCPNNKSIIRGIYETQTLSIPKVPVVFHPQSSSTNDDNDWNDIPAQPKVIKNMLEFETLNKANITAQELFNRFKDTNEFPGSVHMSRLSRAERKKFNAMLVMRTKITAEQNANVQRAKIEAQHNGNTENRDKQKKNDDTKLKVSVKREKLSNDDVKIVENTETIPNNVVSQKLTQLSGKSRENHVQSNRIKNIGFGRGLSLAMKK